MLSDGYSFTFMTLIFAGSSLTKFETLIITVWLFRHWGVASAVLLEKGLQVWV